MTTTTALIAFVLIAMAILIYWLMKRTFDQANTIQTLEQDIAKLNSKQLEREMEFQKQLEIEIKQAKKRANDAQRNVLKGQIGEHLTPFIADFPYNPSECRFLGKPIDYVIFHNLHACSEGFVSIEEVLIIIAEVKTGNAKLNARQKILRQAIENGQFAFKELRIKTDEDLQNAVVIKV